MGNTVKMILEDKRVSSATTLNRDEYKKQSKLYNFEEKNVNLVRLTDRSLLF